MSINKTDCGIFYCGPEPEENVLQQARTHLIDKRCQFMGLMADNHLGYSTPVGGVVAYKNFISPSAVGVDIGCGNKAVKLNAKGKDIRKDIKKIMDEISTQISFGMGRANSESVEHPLFESETWKNDHIKDIGNNIRGFNRSRDKLKDLAASQLGTVGGGNHYVDIFVDEEDNVWVGVHFGSRGLGHKIATYFLKVAGGKDDMSAFPTLIDMDSDLGQDYLDCMNLAGEYAYAGRDWVCDKVAKILKSKILDEVHNHHNFAWSETIDDEEYFVHRKGATPAYPEQRGFVGGSMGDKSVILKGVDSSESKQILHSTVHGAGRVMGRMQAKGKFKPIKDASGKKTGSYECVREPQVKKKDMKKWIKDMGVELRGGDVDESPQVYKRITDVLDAHKDSIEILHWLTPIGVCMAPSNSFDPYKD